MTTAIASQPAWDRIDTVLLDLDGTLLDLAFDTHFWSQHIPAVYGAPRGLSLAESQALLRPKFQAIQHTLDWYCVDYWSRELGLDVQALHREMGHRIGWLPGAQDFLRRLRALGKRVVMLTNSHPKALEVKHECTRVKDYFDAVHSSHTFGVPKEDARFWEAIRQVEPFDRERSMFVDDSLPVLRAARAAGIKWVYAVRLPDSSAGPRAQDQEGFVTTDAVADLR